MTYDAPSSDVKHVASLNGPVANTHTPDLAKARGQSLSTTLAELVARGLSQLDEPVVIGTDEASGLPVLSLGRRVTGEDVGAALDED